MHSLFVAIVQASPVIINVNYCNRPVSVKCGLFIEILANCFSDCGCLRTVVSAKCIQLSSTADSGTCICAWSRMVWQVCPASKVFPFMCQ